MYVPSHWNQWSSALAAPSHRRPWTTACLDIWSTHSFFCVAFLWLCRFSVCIQKLSITIDIEKEKSACICVCTDYHCTWIISKIWSIKPCLSGERCSPSSREEGMEKQSLLKHLAVLPPLSQSSRAWDVKLSQFCDTGPHLKHVWNIKHLRSLAEVGESNYVSETSYMAPWATLAWRCIGTVAVALNIRWSYMKLLAFFQCLKGLCSPQHKAWVCSDFFCLKFPPLQPAGGAPQRSRQVLIAGMRGPDLDIFLWHLVKAPVICLQQYLPHCRHKCHFHIAKTALKLPTAEKARDVGLPHPSSLPRIARKQPLPEAPIFTFIYDSVVFPLQQKKTCQNPIVVTLYTPLSSM